jgi:hypothetical protein
LNFLDLSTPAILGLGFVVIFFLLMLVFALGAMKQAALARNFRPIPAFSRLGKAIGLAVEAGKRMHISLGSAGVSGIPGASALVGLSMLYRIARVSSTSDRPPVATSGDGSVAILSQDTLRNVYSGMGAESQYDPLAGQLTGVTPLSYAAGSLPVIFDQQVSANVLAGHFGAEAALITDAAERSGSATLAGSDSLTGQAVFYAAAREPLIGEELYAGGAYVQAGIMHTASLHAQDVLRWILAIVILAGAALKLAGVW